ncbi:MAG: tetratricopeptide repeat protein [Reyranella sp.]|uniref:tetratricopeptide repeat protein n=1 Tax=Reyranella sp. TaxID=1929291 RepID=UPI0012269BBC|nr:tetratricopeptide repeat protein [Reyranella sp.]TAJ41284.1 MAG: tetratricopeptide repeat protein [Reyranella sp.]
MRFGRILMGAGVVVCAAAAFYGYAYYKYAQRHAAPDIVAVPAPAASPMPVSAPAAATRAPSTRTLYDKCVRGSFPTLDDAEQRNADCSRAIQSRELTPDELALARLIRGSARMALGDKQLGGDDYSDALRRYDSMFDSRNPDALNLFRRAVAEDALGNTDKALELYSEAIRLDPRSTLAFLGRGILLASRKRTYERAIEDLDKVLVLEPDNVLALIRRGAAFGELGETGRGLVDLDRAIALAPSSSQAYFYRGLIHSRRNETAAALSDYDAAVQRGPRNVDALTSRAAIHSLDGKLDLAIQDLDAAIAVDNRNPNVFFNRGYARFAKAEYQKAITDYTSGIDLDENFGLAYNNRCLTRAIVGQDLLRALADCDVALRLMPLNLDVRDTRGFIYLKLGDPALALNEYNAALEKDPNRATALFGRGLARIRSGDIRGGEGDQAAARTINPEIDQQFAVYGLN